jgi:hypothetical protein
MAEGRSNAAIASSILLSVGAVEKHIASIFQKLRLAPSDTDHRRVLAVLGGRSEEEGGGVTPGARRRAAPLAWPVSIATLGL